MAGWGLCNQENTDIDLLFPLFLSFLEESCLGTGLEELCTAVECRQGAGSSSAVLEVHKDPLLLPRGE